MPNNKNGHTGGIWKCKCEECRAYRIAYGKKYRENRSPAQIERIREMNKKWFEANPGYTSKWRKALPDEKKVQYKKKKQEYNDRTKYWRSEKHKEKQKKYSSERWQKIKKERPEYHKEIMEKERLRQERERSSKEGKWRHATLNLKSYYRTNNPELTESDLDEIVNSREDIRYLIQARRSIKEINKYLIINGYKPGNPASYKDGQTYSK